MSYDTQFSIKRASKDAGQINNTAVVGLEGNLYEYRPSHTTTETRKKIVIVHTHYNFFSQLQRFSQLFCIWATIFTTFFFEKIVVKIFVVCEGLKLEIKKGFFASSFLLHNQASLSFIKANQISVVTLPKNNQQILMTFFPNGRSI